jgi:hypothetical protein
MEFRFLIFLAQSPRGCDLDKARKMAFEALAFHLEGLAEDGEAVPEPSSFEEIMAIAQNKDGVAVLIDAPGAEVKSVRINITMPTDVLDQIDQYAQREGFTRSGFLTHPAKKAMAVTRHSGRVLHLIAISRLADGGLRRSKSACSVS